MSDLASPISRPMDITDYKATSSMSVSRNSVQPDSKNTFTLTSGNTSNVIFTIPAQSLSFSNGGNNYLSFNYTMVGSEFETGKSASISNGTGGSFLKNLISYAGSTIIDNITDYNVISAVVDDFQSSGRSRNLASILEDKSTTGIKRGQTRDIATSASEGFTVQRRICIPLMSQLVGTLQDQYLPLDKNYGFRIELTFDDPNVVFKSDLDAGKVLGYTISDLTFEMEYLKTDEMTYRLLEQESMNMFKISGTGITNYSVALPAGSRNNTILVPARNSSVRNFFTTFRKNSSATGRAFNSLGGRTRDNLSNYVYRVGGVNFPNIPVKADAQTSSQTFSEVLKCFHSLHNTISDCVFNKVNYCDSNGETIDGSFLLGVDFEEANQSMQMSGKDTSNANTFLNTEHSENCSALVTNTFCFYDQIIELNLITGGVSVAR